MTKHQEAAIGRIRKLVSDHCGTTNEVKKFEIDDCKYFVSVYVECGLPDDEGTYAQIFARDKAHLFVGKRGGITYPVWKNGAQYRRRFHGYSILEAVVDQRI